MATEFVIWIDGTYKTAIMADSVQPQYIGYGSKLKTLSGKPKELIRAKRLDTILLKFDRMSEDDYDLLYQVWFNNKQFDFHCKLPYLVLNTSTPAFITLDGFKMDHAGGGEYSGTIEIGIE